ncbi:PREDICTED: mucin-12 [Chrysochloris asiatica]|uniref:Mucin-12 n=1 Tax=Chrysochloris asiatica TaxID=185453 RepID=A0A9B0TEN7_CHRAS|nr:PREDICTED: mucin-12 [Chrysochloris asiatica]
MDVRLLRGYCKNGATWDGKQCVCPQGFFGHQRQSLLDFITIETPEKINATVGVTMKMTQRNFPKDLEDSSSKAYQDFMELFRAQLSCFFQMDETYKALLAYWGVTMRKLLNGSVMVEHDAILETNYTLDFQNVFKDLIKTVKAKIVNKTKELLEDPEKCQSISVVCYSEDTMAVTETAKLNFDPPPQSKQHIEQCERNAAKDFAQFYYVDELDKKLLCVTKCSPGTKTQLNCHQGVCQVQHSGLPCLLVDGSVGAVVAVLVVLVVVLTVFLFQACSQLPTKAMTSDLFESPPVASSVSGPHWSALQVCSEQSDKVLKEDRCGLESTYSHFRPSLENLETIAEVTQGSPSAHFCLVSQRQTSLIQTSGYSGVRVPENQE